MRRSNEVVITTRVISISYIKTDASNLFDRNRPIKKELRLESNSITILVISGNDKDKVYKNPNTTTT
jgi:hypothetical protein